MRLWYLFLGLLILGLISPVYAGVAGVVVVDLSDPISQAIVWFMLPVFVILFAYLTIFQREERE